MTMKISTLVRGLLLAAILSPAQLAWAEPQKIGYVDVKGVAARSASIQSSVRDVEGKLRVKQEDMENHVREYRATKKDFDSQRSVLADAEAKKQDRKLQEMRDKLDAMQLDIDKELRRTETDVMGPAVDRIVETVRRIGKAQGYDLVLTSDVVIYGAEAVDLTPLVIQELDKTAGAAGSTDAATAPETKTEAAKPPPSPPSKPEPKTPAPKKRSK